MHLFYMTDTVCIYIRTYLHLYFLVAVTTPVINQQAFNIQKPQVVTTATTTTAGSYLTKPVYAYGYIISIFMQKFL